MSKRSLLIPTTLSIVLLQALPAFSATLKVGPDKQFKTVRAAALVVQDGDIVEVDGGVYSGDVATWRKNNLTVRGVGGSRPHLTANGKNEAEKGIWVVQGANFTVENFEFSGASVPDQNGAGIRAEATGTIWIRNCYFHDNEDGLLGPNDPNTDLIIENSIFDHNGFGDGYSHNLYVGRIRSFTMRFSYSHRARVGHNVKSRARKNYILCSRIMDENSGTASYQIDLPEGGLAIIIGNLIQQGPMAENSSIIAYGAENANAGALRLHVINNTIVNERPGGGTFLHLRNGTTGTVVNNIFYGPGTTWSGSGVTLTTSNNYVERSYNNSPRFSNVAGFDYHLQKDSPCRDAGIPSGMIDEFDLTPRYEYVHDALGAPRRNVGNIDIGAFEFSPLSPAPPSNPRIIRLQAGRN